jgi:hypothetical protein
VGVLHEVKALEEVNLTAREGRVFALLGRTVQSTRCFGPFAIASTTLQIVETPAFDVRLMEKMKEPRGQDFSDVKEGA